MAEEDVKNAADESVPEKKERTKKVVPQKKAAVAEGKGVAVKEGKFVGPPMVKMAEKILYKHNMIQQKRQSL